MEALYGQIMTGRLYSAGGSYPASQMKHLISKWHLLEECDKKSVRLNQLGKFNMVEILQTQVNVAGQKFRNCRAGHGYVIVTIN